MKNDQNRRRRHQNKKETQISKEDVGARGKLLNSSPRGNAKTDRLT